MRFVDLFCGCGGLSLGFIKAGLDHRLSLDVSEQAVRVFNANLGGGAAVQDLADVTGTVARLLPLRPDLIAGGPPCQEFSAAGKRQHGERARLTIAFARIVVAVRPRWFVMENVPGALRSPAFREAGYGLTTLVLDASRCDVPQRRRRLVCIGRLGEPDGFLTASLEAGLRDRPSTPREYLGDALGIEAYYAHPRFYARRAIFSVHEPAPTIRGVNRPVPRGRPRHPRDAADPAAVRPLTLAERARLQTFPAGFDFAAVSRTEAEQMVGNAVPPEMAAYVAWAVLDHEHRARSGAHAAAGALGPPAAASDPPGSTSAARPDPDRIRPRSGREQERRRGATAASGRQAGHAQRTGPLADQLAAAAGDHRPGLGTARDRILALGPGTGRCRESGGQGASAVGSATATPGYGRRRGCSRRASSTGLGRAVIRAAAIDRSARRAGTSRAGSASPCRASTARVPTATGPSRTPERHRCCCAASPAPDRAFWPVTSARPTAWTADRRCRAGPATIRGPPGQGPRPPERRSARGLDLLGRTPRAPPTRAGSTGPEPSIAPRARGSGVRRSRRRRPSSVDGSIRVPVPSGTWRAT